MAFYFTQLKQKMIEIQNIINDLQGNGIYKRDESGKPTTEVRQETLNRLFEAQRQAANLTQLAESESRRAARCNYQRP